MPCITQLYSLPRMPEGPFGTGPKPTTSGSIASIDFWSRYENHMPRRIPGLARSPVSTGLVNRPWSFSNGSRNILATNV